jgi:hypothetical protein
VLLLAIGMTAKGRLYEARLDVCERRGIDATLAAGAR